MGDRSYRVRSYQSADEMEYMEYMLSYLCSWPVYPSFTRTIQVLQSQGLEPGSFFAAEDVREIRIEVDELLAVSDTGEIIYPQGEELEKLQKENPYYRANGALVFNTPEAIETIMTALSESELDSMNGFYRKAPIQQAVVTMKNGSGLSAVFAADKMTPQVVELFRGLPGVK